MGRRSFSKEFKLKAARGVLITRLCGKRRLYWIIAVIVLSVSLTATPYVYGYLHLAHARSWLFEELAKWPRPLEPRFVKVVLVGDDEYWRGYPEGRRPIKRDYLAQLVQALDMAGAQVIALDFDVRLPDPEAMAIPARYKAETDALIRALLHAADSGKKVVLSKTIRFDNSGGYALDPDIYQVYGICARLDKKGTWQSPGTADFSISERTSKNISCGYIALPYDELAIPGRLNLADGTYLDSFALAVAKAKNYDIVAKAGTNTSYANYIPQDRMNDFHAILSAHDLLFAAPDKNKDRLQSEAVIVGASWSVFAYDRGTPVDIHSTPVGATVGAVIHENFAEAFLDSRDFPALPGWLVDGAEIVFALLAAIVLALWGPVIAALPLFIFLIAIQWLCLHMAGVFFDAFIPLLALTLHSLCDVYASRWI